MREIAQRTEEIVAAGEYVTGDGRTIHLADAVARAREGTRVYGPEPVTVPHAPAVATPSVEVTGESSLDAARRMTGERAERIAVLNFASARNPGGGFLNGAQAQEEAVCRSSALYTCLLEAPEFYEHHRADRDVFYTDRVIHSPGVPVFRDDRGRLLDEPFEVGFLTSPAPNAGVIARHTPERVDRIPAALASRAGRVLEVAALHGYRRLVLGAWGCGVFRNEPEQVARAFADLLDGRFHGRFEQVVFAILDRTKDAATRSAFERVLTGRQGLSPRAAQRQP
nr:TIGR02452 family protein [Streptomyces sp. SID8367]